jgi:hypothetical protein
LAATWRPGSPLEPDDPASLRRHLESEADAARELSRHTRFPTPEPVALGDPGAGYPLPWLVQTWVPGTDWDRIFLPFQRLDGTGTTTGVGLGLTVSRSLTEAMRGTLEPEETPGGGLTMAISVPAASTPSHTSANRPESGEFQPAGP